MPDANPDARLSLLLSLTLPLLLLFLLASRLIRPNKSPPPPLCRVAFSARRIASDAIPKQTSGETKPNTTITTPTTNGAPLKKSSSAPPDEILQAPEKRDPLQVVVPTAVREALQEIRGLRRTCDLAHAAAHAPAHLRDHMQ